MEIKNKKIIILAPHTDDGELGCGGSIAKLVKDNEIYYVAFSSCQKSLPLGADPEMLVKEVQRATNVLNIRKSHLLIFKYPVRDFPEKRQPILEDMIKLKNKINPDIVFLPSPQDIHQDHKTISEEGLRAFKNSTILGYEMPWNNASFNTRCFIPLKEDNILTKIRALEEYKSQFNRSYLNENFIRSLATVRGIQIGEQYAESFEIIRLILK